MHFFNVLFGYLVRKPTAANLNPCFTFILVLMTKGTFSKCGLLLKSFFLSLSQLTVVFKSVFDNGENWTISPVGTKKAVLQRNITEASF